MAASPALAPVLAGRSSAGHISNTTAASVAEDKQERGAVEGAGEGGAAALVQLGHK